MIQATLSIISSVFAWATVLLGALLIGIALLWAIMLVVNIALRRLGIVCRCAYFVAHRERLCREMSEYVERNQHAEVRHWVEADKKT